MMCVCNKDEIKGDGDFAMQVFAYINIHIH